MNEEVVLMLKSEVARLLEQPEELVSEDKNLADMGVDSLQALQLLVQIERTYQIQLPEDELEKFTSIRSMAHLVETHLSASSAMHASV